jgi:hypothetical protein
VKSSSEHLPYKRYWNEGEVKNTLSKKSHTRPPSHHHDFYGSAVLVLVVARAVTRSHPRILNSDPTLEIGKVSGACNHSTFPSSNWEHLPSSFSALAFLSMQKIAVLNASRMAALAAAGKVVSFF